MAIPSITELTILKSLWKQHPLSARELHDQVEAELDWSYSSTRKTLERMLDKGYVRQHLLHGVQVYDAALEKVAREVVGRPVRLAIVVGATNSASLAASVEPSAATQAALQDPAVQGILEAFQGQLIRVDPPADES